MRCASRLGGPRERRPHGRLAQLERAPAEAIVELVDRLVRPETFAIDVEVAPGDVARLEESAPARVVVAGQLQQLGLGEALTGRGGRHRRQSRKVHRDLLSARRT